MKLTIELDVPRWRNALAGIGDRFDEAVSASMNMAAALARQLGQADIAQAGSFGARWIDALQVAVTGSGNNMRLSMKLNVPGADIFETGGVIQGKPLLWLPLSGTDAVGVPPKDYGGLFSAKSSKGLPLLFSLADKLPRYFGIPSVTIPQLFHLRDDLNDVKEVYRAVFDEAWASTAS